MISSPCCGWCDFKVGDFSGKASYLMTTPLDLVDCFLEYFDKGSGSAYIDEEGTNFTFVVSDVEIFIIAMEDDGEYHLHIMEKLFPADLAKELIFDIEPFYDLWCSRFFGFGEDLEYDEKINQELSEGIKKLKDVLRIRGYWDDDCDEKVKSIATVADNEEDKKEGERKDED